MQTVTLQLQCLLQEPEIVQIDLDEKGQLAAFRPLFYDLPEAAQALIFRPAARPWVRPAFESWRERLGSLLPFLAEKRMIRAAWPPCLEPLREPLLLLKTDENEFADAPIEHLTDAVFALAMPERLHEEFASRLRFCADPRFVAPLAASPERIHFFADGWEKWAAAPLDDSVFEGLKQKMGQKDWLFRAKSALALIVWCGEKGRRAVAETIGETIGEDEYAAFDDSFLRVLKRLGGPGCVPLLLALGQSKSNVLAVVETLAELPDGAEGIPFLAELFRDNSGGAWPGQVGKTLVRIGTHEAIEVLIGGLPSAVDNVWLTAVKQLGKMRCRAALPGLLALLSSQKKAEKALAAIVEIVGKAPLSPDDSALALEMAAQIRLKKAAKKALKNEVAAAFEQAILMLEKV